MLQVRILPILALLLGPLLGAPMTADAQQAPDDRLLAFAHVHLEIANIRDELHQQLALYHEVDGRTRARAEADAAIEESMERHGVDPAEYQEFLVLISADEELMETFQNALDQARDSEDGN